MNIGNTFLDKAEAQLQQPAITFEQQVYTYEHITILIQKWRSFLTSKIKPGDRVLCFSDNCPEVMALYLAVAGLGNVFIPINPKLSEEEIVDIIERSTPALAVASNNDAFKFPNIPEVVGIKEFSKEGTLNFPIPRFTEVDEEQGCLICFTSGSTGRAKGVYASHINEYTSCEQYAKSWKVTAQDKVLIALPQSFLYGLTTGCLMALFVGAHIYLEKKFHPVEALTRIEQQRITLFMGVPTMYTMMLDVQRKATKPYDTKSLRLLLTAGAPIADEILAEFKKTFNIQLSNFYALSEIRPIFTHEAGLPIKKQQSCGRAVEDVEVRLLNVEGNDITVPGQEGELIARSATLMLAYYGDPEITAQTVRDGWFYTGDLAVFDEAGYYYITGRKKELVIRGGINISPVEVESFIYKHPAVLETVVIGVPDKVFGEELFTQIVLKDGQTLSKQQLVEFLSDKLAPYKIPKHIEFVQSLAKNHSGKISKKRVREQWEQSALQQHS